MKITKNMKIAGATIMTLFSLVASFTAAIAWLSPESNEVTANGMIVKADNFTTSFVSVEVHKSIPDQCTPTTLAFSSEVAMSMTDGLSPNRTLIIDDFGDLNKSQPVLLLFNLKKGVTAEDVLITAKTNSSSSWCPNITPENVNSYPLSNAIYFRSGAFYKTGTTFQFESINISDLKQESKFVVNSGSSFTLDKDITVFDGTHHPDSSNPDPTASVSHVAVVLDYYTPALEVIQAFATLSPYVVGGVVDEQPVAGNNNRLGFSCDWKMFVS